MWQISSGTVTTDSMTDLSPTSLNSHLIVYLEFFSELLIFLNKALISFLILQVSVNKLIVIKVIAVRNMCLPPFLKKRVFCFALKKLIKKP